MTKIAELRDLSDTELAGKACELNEELFNLRIQKCTNKLENPMRPRQVRKIVAWIKTILNERKITRRIKSVLNERNTDQSN